MVVSRKSMCQWPQRSSIEVYLVTAEVIFKYSHTESCLSSTQEAGWLNMSRNEWMCSGCSGQTDRSTTDSMLPSVSQTRSSSLEETHSCELPAPVSLHYTSLCFIHDSRIKPRRLRFCQASNSRFLPVYFTVLRLFSFGLLTFTHSAVTVAFSGCIMWFGWCVWGYLSGKS